MSELHELRAGYQVYPGMTLRGIILDILPQDWALEIISERANTLLTYIAEAGSVYSQLETLIKSAHCVMFVNDDDKRVSIMDEHNYRAMTEEPPELPNIPYYPPFPPEGNDSDEVSEDVVRRELEAWRNRHQKQISLDKRSMVSVIYDKFLYDGDVQAHIGYMQAKRDTEYVRLTIQRTLDYAIKMGSNEIGFKEDMMPDPYIDFELLSLLIGETLD